MRPTLATCGWQKVAPATRFWSTGWVGAAGGVLDRDDALLGGLVGERLGVDQVADRVDLGVGGAAELVDLDLAPLGQLDPGRLQAEPLDVGGATAGDAEVVDLGRVVAVGELDRVAARLDVLDRGAGGDRDVLLLEGPLDDPRHVLVLGGEDLVEHLDQQHLGAEAAVGGGDLAARGAGADDGDLLRLLGQRPGAPGVEHAVAELDPGDRQRDRAGGEHHGARLVDVVADRDVALGGERAVALDPVVTLFLSQSIFTPLESESETAARRLPRASQSIEASLTTTPSSALLRAWS